MTDETTETTQEVSTEEPTQDITSLNTIGDIFDDSPSEAMKAEPEDEKGETEGETETEQEPVEAKSEEVETPATEETVGLKAALSAERRKRQEAEQKLNAQKQEVPDPIENPEGYAEYIKTQHSQDTTSTKISLSRDMMMDANEDYADKEKVFMDLVGVEYDDNGQAIAVDDQKLYREFISSPNPARFAYNKAKEHLEVQRLKSPAYREQLRAELKAELEAELKQKDKGGVSATEVPDLTNATASGSNSQRLSSRDEISSVFSDAAA
tara:strand:+ start:1884 stop:2684 length:801 start_codon:yes stop_codon:yes gene_type:complete